jgi:2-polyprenyl-6-methoxyphenol hydroxylase-like FAD-dependent oxidoreductase
VYDLIVVGARCAGAPTAMLFARAGYRVLLVDRARFPSDTLSTHYIHQPGVLQLARWGLLDNLIRSGCPPMKRGVYTVGDVRLEGAAPPLQGIRAAYAPRRYILDQLLIDAAIAAGVEFREHCTVVDLIHDEDRVAGIRYRLGRSREIKTERASLVVGADGMRSTVARIMGAGVYASDPCMSCAYYTYWPGYREHFELHQQNGGWVGAFGTHDNLTLVVAYFPQSEFDRVRSDPMTAYRENIRLTSPSVFESLEAAKPAAPLLGTGTQENFFRHAFGPGWVLVGDAGHHKDSITAHGITDAFFQAQLLFDCISDQLDNQRGLMASLKRFQVERDLHMERTYQGTIVVARLVVQQDRLMALRQIQADPVLTNRYFALLAGIITIEDLYNRELELKVAG